MDKATVFVIFTIIKSVVGIAGLAITFVSIILWITQKNDKLLKRAAIAFFGSIALVLVLTVLEFLIAFNLTNE